MGVKVIVKDGVTYWEEDAATVRQINKQVAAAVKAAAVAKAKAKKA